MKWINPCQEKVFDILCDKKNSFYLWGISATGTRFVEQFKDVINIKGIIDSDEALAGSSVFGYTVLNPKEVEFCDDDKIIITINTVQYIYEVYQYLEAKNYVENVDFFRYSVAQRVLYYYFFNTVFLGQTDLVLTSKCTLNCKECLMQIPYVKLPKNLSWEEIINRIDLSFKFVDRFGEYHLVGGEPTVNPHIKEAVDYLYKNYGERIDKICIVTNAMGNPEKELIDTLKKCKGSVIISDYSYSTEFYKDTKVDDWIRVLKENGVEYVIRKQDKWNELGREDNNDYNEEDLRSCYDFCDCGAGKTIMFQNDRVYLCARAASAEDWALSDINNEDSLMLGSVTEESRRMFLEYTMGFTKKGYLEECKKCYVGRFNWEDRIPAAKQVERI